jgi:hypothetical protein
MVDETAPARRRPNALGKIMRRRRIFARLREGWAYDEIAAQEGLTATRIRQIVAEVLEKRAVDSGANHAKLQLARLAAGDVSAISPYLKALDRLDRYQSVAVANQAYDEEARRKLMEKINRMAENLGVDEMWKAAREYLKKHGAFPADASGPGEAEAAGDPAGLPEPQPEGQSEASRWMSV